MTYQRISYSVVLLVWVVTALFSCIAAHATEEASGTTFAFASYYGNHMVLQRAPKASVLWGYASLEDLGKSVMVTLMDAKGPVQQTHQVSVRRGPFADRAVWIAEFDPVIKPGPYVIQAVLEQNKLGLSDVLFGDVWVCSGQSNMVFTINQVFNKSTFYADSKNFPNIRLFHAGLVHSSVPLYDLTSVYLQWSPPSEKTLNGFSAVCYIYATIVNKNIDVPLGLVESAWGGTPVEAWSSPDALAMCGLKDKVPSSENKLGRDGLAIYQNLLKELQRSYPEQHIPVYSPAPHHKTVLWNAMIHPLLNMTIYGVLWYQGESNANANTSDVYNCTFPALISDWRNKFSPGKYGQSSPFPFGFVQIGPNTPDHTILSRYCDIRWHQTADVGYAPNTRLKNTFMAVSVDLTDNTSPYGGVHYRDKNTTAHRFALSGLSVAYNRPNLKYQGPLPSAYYVDIGYDTLRIEYDQRKSQLYVKNATAVNAYEMCCSTDNQTGCPMDGNNWVRAPIIASDAHSVTLSFKSCDRMWVMGWRYIWRETPCEYKSCPLYTVENNLPAAPFLVQGLVGSKEVWLLKQEMWQKKHTETGWMEFLEETRRVSATKL